MRDRPALDLFLISWLILFLELACIRWFPSHVVFLTFFTNTVLLASFVGMSVGCMIAKKPGRELLRTPVWLAVALAAGLLTDTYFEKLERVIDVGGQANPEVVFFGTEVSALKDRQFLIPIEVFGGLFFVLVAAVLVGPGQEMGRAFNRVPVRTTAYAVNLLGSLAGIASFAACSYLELPPVAWFGAAVIGLAYFLLRPDPSAPAVGLLRGCLIAACLAAAFVMTAVTSGLAYVEEGPVHRIYWSPYYRVDFNPEYSLIATNRVSHQMMIPKGLPSQSGYAIPYLFQRDIKGADGRGAWPPIKRVLIIGAGSGNDVSRALQWCGPDARIDAVEIDPAIQRIGINQHPDRPYADPRVNRVLNDGRNFLKRAPDAEYDLVVFALVDSLVLHSGYSNIRLESFLFTTESFRDVRRVLKPTGVAAVYNYFRQGWIIARLRDGLRDVFGADPVVFTDPPRDRITLDPDPTKRDDIAGFSAVYAGSPETLAPLRAAFDHSAQNAYWLPSGEPLTPTDTPNGFRTEPPPGWTPADQGWGRLRIAAVEESNGALRPATDDWPFLYVRKPTIPSHTLRGIGIVVLLSLGIWYVFRGKPAAGGAPGVFGAEGGLAARSFFLGAGFMLVETKAVVQMALLFGSTWMVNTFVFGFILVMSLAGTLFAARVKPTRLEPYYIGLFASLALNLLIPLNAFLGLDRTVQVIGSCALAFAPVAFAGVIFAVSFARSQQPAVVFGANVAGALAGGLAENTSMVLGFQYLLCVAVGFYVLSAAFGNRSLPAVGAEQKV